MWTDFFFSILSFTHVQCTHSPSTAPCMLARYSFQWFVFSLDLRLLFSFLAVWRLSCHSSSVSTVSPACVFLFRCLSFFQVMSMLAPLAPSRSRRAGVCIENQCRWIRGWLTSARAWSCVLNRFAAHPHEPTAHTVSKLSATPLSPALLHEGGAGGSCRAGKCNRVISSRLKVRSPSNTDPRDSRCTFHLATPIPIK
jgi:hypothetical protein